MKIVSIICFKWNPENPIKVSDAYNLDQFSYFQRGTIKECCLVFSRLFVSRTSPSTTIAIDLSNQTEYSFLDNYIMYIDINKDLFTKTIITVKDYPKRLIYEILEQVKGNTDLDVLIKTYSNVKETDKILKIQNELDQTKKIMVKNIEQVLKRGEKIESLVEKSEELSRLGGIYIREAKKLNSCCLIL